MLLSPEILFPDIGSFKEVNLNDWLRTNCPVRPNGPDSYQHEINRLNQEYGAPTYGGWLEYREWMWAGSYMTAKRKYTHLGVDIYLPQGASPRLPFDVTVINSFYDEDDDVGWGGRLTVRREANQPALVFGHLEAKLPEKDTLIPANTPLGKLATWPENGNVFEHLHVQIIRPELLPALKWDKLDGYGFAYQCKDYPHPFQTEL